MSEKKCPVCALRQEGYRKWCRDCGFLFPKETLSSIWDPNPDSEQENNTEDISIEAASETLYGVPIAMLLDAEEPEEMPKEMLVPEVELDDSEAPTELWSRPTKQD